MRELGRTNSLHRIPQPQCSRPVICLNTRGDARVNAARRRQPAYACINMTFLALGWYRRGVVCLPACETGPSLWRCLETRHTLKHYAPEGTWLAQDSACRPLTSIDDMAHRDRWPLLPVTTETSTRDCTCASKGKPTTDVAVLVSLTKPCPEASDSNSSRTF